MLDTRGEHVRLLLDGGEDSLLLGRSALARGRAHSALDEGDAQNLGGLKLRLESTEGLHILLQELLADGPYLYISLKGISLPRHLKGNQFTKAYSITRRPLLGDPAAYSMRGTSYKNRIFTAIRASSSPEMPWYEEHRSTLYKAKDQPTPQKPAPLATFDFTDTLPFSYQDAIGVITNYSGIADPNPSATMSVYDLKGVLQQAETFHFPKAPSGFSTLRLEASAGKDHRFYTFTVYGESSLDRGFVILQARQIDAPDTVLWSRTLTMDRNYTDRVLNGEKSQEVYEYGNFLFFCWVKRKWTNQLLGKQAFLGDWTVLDRTTGEIKATYPNQPFHQITIDPKAGCFTMGIPVVTLTKASPVLPYYVNALFEYHFDQYVFDDQADPPTLTFKKALGTGSATVTGDNLPDSVDDTSMRLVSVYDL